MNAAEITAALGGRWHGRFGSVCCPAHEDRNPSLSLADGDDGRLLAYCHSGCSFGSVLDALRGHGLLDGSWCQEPTTCEEIERVRAAENEYAAKKAERARAIWTDPASVPVHGTPAGRYLRRRGITCALPDTLRYQPQGFHPTAQRLPMMVARVDGAPKFAVHRTYLREDGGGKANVAPNRCMLGGTAGGAVHLSNGRGPLVVAEGIETALSLLCGIVSPDARVWAALSMSGMKRLTLPTAPGELFVATDGEDQGRQAGGVLAERADALGWTVSLLPAPAGLDWNDVVRERAAT